LVEKWIVLRTSYTGQYRWPPCDVALCLIYVVTSYLSIPFLSGSQETDRTLEQLWILLMVNPINTRRAKLTLVL